MYEGKNIHYSQVDQKPLCSFSGKICNQRRLNKYGFCVRHILEDPNAPFKRCAYVAKSSRQTCTQPIPKNEEREYCNNHMQVLGMLPKKARKPKKEKEKLAPSMPDPFSSHPGTMSVPLLLQSKTKPKLTVSGFKNKLLSGKISSMSEMDDVYAFPADVSDNVNKSSVSTMITSVAIQDLSPSSSKAVTYSTFTTKTTSSEGTGSHSSLAKIYPELAEKLEKIKPKLVDPKVKGKVKSSRTMNSLQTKIAQNKIKDKLKRNQSSSNASSQSQSPSHGFTSVNSPGCQISPASSPNIILPVSSPAAGQSSQNLIRTSSDISSMITLNSVSDPLNSLSVSATRLQPQQPLHGLSQFNLLNTLNLQSLNSSLAQLGFPVPAASDIEQTLKQLAKAANISLEGAPVQTDASSSHATSQTSTIPVVPGLPGGYLPRTPDLSGVLKPSFTSLSGPPPPYSSIHHKPSGPVSLDAPVSVSHSSTNVMNVTDSVKRPTSSHLVSSQSLVLQRPSLSQENISKFVPTVAALTNTSSLNSSSLSLKQSSVTTHPTAVLTSVSSSSSSTKAAAAAKSLHVESQPKASVNITQVTKATKVEESPEPNVSNLSPSLNVKPRPQKPKSRSRNSSSALSKRPVPVFTLPMTVVKPQKIRKLLSDENIKKFKDKSAISYYQKYKLRKECNHDLIISGFDSSDDSDLSDCDMLPWQPDWFKVSSDEEGCDEDESDYDMRTTKLALARAQLRRQCFQARQSYRSNMTVCHYNNDSTSTLIQAAKVGARIAVSAVNEINGKKPKSVDRYKTRGLDKRRCLYRDNDEVQCKGNVVPYTNHCIKHVMYNVDQQMFEYCTAKFADNTQCCHPVIDLKRELPLCMEHGQKADNFLKTQDAEPKPKRPRKKTKPSALTRPPKKGKKKKNQRKSAQQQKALEKANEEAAGSHDSEEDGLGNDSGNEAMDVDMDEADEDTEKEEAEEATTAVPSKSALLKASSVMTSRSIDQTVKTDHKPVIAVERKSEKHASIGQLEELENLTGLPELDNVKMFGDLPLETASKLLEENDLQEVLNRLPDEAFDIFNKTSALPSNEELEELEKSLALANRDLRFTKDSIDHLSNPSELPASLRRQQQQQQSSLPPILDDADEITRQIAEEILKQNIGNESVLNQSSVCNGDAQESIKAIARSLSNSGMLLTSNINQGTSQSQDISVIQGRSASLSRSQTLNPNPYSCVNPVFIPPNVAIQSIGVAQPRILPASVPSSTFNVTKSQGSVMTTLGQPTNFVPRNVTVMPQGVFQTQIPFSTHSVPQLPISTQVTSINASVNNSALSQTNTCTTSATGAVNYQGGQHITAQQLSQLVQQAALQLPPVPPYIPRQTQTVVTQPATVSSIHTPTSASQLSQQQLQAHQQQLARQREKLTQQQQHLLTQQLLQQHLLALAQQQLNQQNQLAQKLQAEPLINMQQQVQVNQGKTQPLLTSSNMNLSALLQAGHKINHLPTMSNVNVQVPQLIKANYQASQPVVTSSVISQVTLPTANIVWTAPPNVTITSSNGFTRNVLQGPTSISHTMSAGSIEKVKQIDTVIDLTDSNDPPAYQPNEKALSSQPPPNYPSHTVSTSRGKS